MKKYLVSFFAVMAFAACCLVGLNAYAADAISIEGASVSLSHDSFTYKANEKRPSVYLTLDVTDEETGEVNTIKLKNRKDFEVEYINNVNAGTATAKITGINNYCGTIEKNFTINPMSISDSSVKITTLSKAYPNVAPQFNVKYKSEALVKDVDYTVTCENYDKTGINRAKVTFVGLGNFKGKKTLKVNVYPKKVTNVASASRKTDSITLKWKSQKDFGVTGYRVYLCDSDGKSHSFYGTTTTNSITVTNRTAGNYYYFVIRAYKTKENKTIYGDYSPVYKTVAKPQKVTINSVTKNADKDKITVKWDKVGCTSYEIQYTTDKKFKKHVKSVIVKGGSKTKKTINIAVNDKTYYARIRPFRQYKSAGNTVRVNGKWSSKLSTNYSKLYSTYTTYYVNNPNRTTNLKLACKAINNTVIYPGETFSFNQVVGKRTSAKGYKPAPIFVGSNGHEDGIGGGICQVASTMFNATLKANLGIVERHQHSQRVTYCPLGRDAAIFWGSYDYKFKNTTNYPIKIKMSCKDGKLTCSFYTCYDVSPKKVKLEVNQNGRNFTLKRYVDGKCNYTTRSNY